MVQKPGGGEGGDRGEGGEEEEEKEKVVINDETDMLDSLTGNKTDMHDKGTDNDEMDMFEFRLNCRHYYYYYLFIIIIIIMSFMNTFT